MPSSSSSSGSLLDQADDKSYLVGKTALQWGQYACLAATPIYAVQAVRHGSFSFRQLARYNWLVPLGGGAVGGAYGAATSASQNAASLKAEATKVRYDKARVRQEDYHLIGAAVGALVLPALLLKRVGLLNGALGGAGLGGAAGLGYNFAQGGGGALSGKPALQRDAESAAGSAEAKARALGNDAEAKAREIGGDAQSAARDWGNRALAKGEQAESKLKELGNKALAKGKEAVGQ